MEGIKIKQEKGDAQMGGGAGPSGGGAQDVVAQFRARIFELAKEFPTGIPDKILKNDMPSLSTEDRAAAINKLLADGNLELYKQGNELIYKVKTETDKTSDPEQMKDADKEERVVFEIIKDAGNMGIWMKEIRGKCNLSMPATNKIVKALENKKIIKAVKSVSASKKKVYMLYELEPHRSLTGGAWYSDQDFDQEFVTVLNHQCYKYLLDKKQRANNTPKDLGPKIRMTKALATLEEIWKYICNLGISKTELTTDDISSILNTLIYDGKVQKIHKGEMQYYMATEAMVETTGLIQAPCGVCPVAKDCSEYGSVNPVACIYITNWLGTDF